ncbi:Protein of unknown function [Gryllus bimaculatus]|nr:Protein of unknown function [Gryllus bimaculatus]
MEQLRLHCEYVYCGLVIISDCYVFGLDIHGWICHHFGVIVGFEVGLNSEGLGESQQQQRWRRRRCGGPSGR